MCFCWGCVWGVRSGVWGGSVDRYIKIFSSRWSGIIGGDVRCFGSLVGI